jgi:N-acetylglucosaminyldiphosphoundecaprenol N-acetyl-beta-D-mannosaminyltransferase
MATQAFLFEENKRFSLLNVDVDALTFTDIIAIIANAVACGERCLIANHNLHSIYLYHQDPKFAELYSKADYIYIDGMPIVHLGRAMGLPFSPATRVTFLDCFTGLMSEAARRSWRVFYLGSKPGVAERGASLLCQLFPTLQIRTHQGHFDATLGGESNRAVVEQINAFEPNILMVGMGMPRQEYWASENLESLRANAIITSGATMDYLAGEIATPPRWTGPFGLYGLSRLIHEPRRLWRRYLLEPWLLMAILARQSFADRKAYESEKSVLLD